MKEDNATVMEKGNYIQSKNIYISFVKNYDSSQATSMYSHYFSRKVTKSRHYSQIAIAFKGVHSDREEQLMGKECNQPIQLWILRSHI